jgi:hypothetical protein
LVKDLQLVPERACGFCQLFVCQRDLSRRRRPSVATRSKGLATKNARNFAAESARRQPAETNGYDRSVGSFHLFVSLLTVAMLTAGAAPARPQAPVAGTMITTNTRVPAGVYIRNDDVSFNSGIGIGLSRASGNTIQHDRVDSDLRGHSHTFDNRRQDSTGILSDEQSNPGVAAFQLRNTRRSRVLPLGWTDGDGHRRPMGRPPFASLIAAKRFARHIEAIAIEYGQNDRVSDNRFDADETAIHLWSNTDQDPSWGYVYESGASIADDGIRVWMDDERVIDRWTPRESALDSALVAGGRHRRKVQYYEIGGVAELRFEMLRR